MKILVLMGGDSPEREISLLSGRAVAEGLRRAGHQVEAVDIPDVATVMDLAQVRDADVVFPALHGGQGEDGHLQALLDLRDVPYALSGHAASALAMDKGATKRVMRSAGVPTPDWLQVTWDSRAEAILAGDQGRARPGESLTVNHIQERCAAELGYPLVIKLNGAGSSVGWRSSRNREDSPPPSPRSPAPETRPARTYSSRNSFPGGS